MGARASKELAMSGTDSSRDSQSGSHGSWAKGAFNVASISRILQRGCLYILACNTNTQRTSRSSGRYLSQFASSSGMFFGESAGRSSESMTCRYPLQVAILVLECVVCMQIHVQHTRPTYLFMIRPRWPQGVAAQVCDDRL